MEFISLTSSAASVLHLDEVQRATNWCMHVLEFPFSVLLLALGYLSLPDLPIIRLGILLSLRLHLEVLFVVLDLGVELSFFDMSLVFELVNLIQKALFGSAEGGSSGSHVPLNLLQTILVVSVAVVREIIDWFFEHIWYDAFAVEQEFFVNIEFGLGFVGSLFSVEFGSHCQRIDSLFCRFVMS